MNDQALRELERSVERDGSAANRLRFARELVRVGERDHAVETLLPVKADLGARDLLLDLRPASRAWEFADVMPLARSPRLLWKRQLGGRASSGCIPLGHYLAATPLAVAAQHGDGELVLVDPRSGERLAELPPERTRTVDRIALVGDGVWITRASGVIDAFDLAGKRASSTRVNGARSSDHGVLIAHPADGEVALYSLASARKGPVLETSWRNPELQPGERGCLRLRGSLLFVLAERGIAAFDRMEGRSLWSCDPGDGRAHMLEGLCLVDGGGRSRKRVPRTTARDKTGAILWEARARVYEALATEELIIAIVERETPAASSLEVLARDTGETWGCLHDDAGPRDPVAVARDVVIFQTRTDGGIWLVAKQIDTTELWRVELSDLGIRSVSVLVMLDRMVVGLSTSGELFAFGE